MDLVGAWMEVVDGMHAGHGHGGLCWKMPEHFPSAR